MADTLKPRSIKTLKQLRERIRNGTGKRYSKTVSVDDKKKSVTNKMWGAAIEHLARAHVEKRKSMDWGFVACIDAESCASATAANQALTNAGLDPSADRILAVNFGPPECIARMRTNVEDNGIATVLPGCWGRAITCTRFLPGNLRAAYIDGCCSATSLINRGDIATAINAFHETQVCVLATTFSTRDTFSNATERVWSHIEEQVSTTFKTMHQVKLVFAENYRASLFFMLALIGPEESETFDVLLATLTTSKMKKQLEQVTRMVTARQGVKKPRNMAEKAYNYKEISRARFCFPDSDSDSDTKPMKKSWHYRVVWSSTEATWEPEHNIVNRHAPQTRRTLMRLRAVAQRRSRC